MEGNKNQLRKMDSISAIGRLTLEIPLIAKEYGARFDLSDNVVQEAIRLIMNKFSKLGLNEIREAYREFASGEIKVQGAEMYGGEFNVATLGKILTAYSTHRAKILAEILKAEFDIQAEAKEKSRAKSLSEKFNLEFPEKVMAAKNEITEWKNIPAFWYDAMRKRGWIDLSKEEYSTIWSESLSLAIEEMNHRKNEETNIFKKYNSDDLMAIRKNISKQIAVFEKVIKNKNWTIPQPTAL